MPDLHVFEYAVIRIVPRVEREEFLNAGVVLFCRNKKFLQTRIRLDPKRLEAFSCTLDMDVIAANLHAFEQITLGSKEAGPIGALDIAERFRWLTATRSTVVQSSKIHPGLSADPSATLDLLFQQLVVC
jgi:hypothetical protein